MSRKGKVAFPFKSFIEGKSVWEAPAQKKVKVHTVGKGKKPVRSKRGKGQADTEWGSDESGSDDKPRLRKEAMEETKSNDEVHSVLYTPPHTPVGLQVDSFQSRWSLPWMQQNLIFLDHQARVLMDST
jgi:hypothetical protein